MSKALEARGLTQVQAAKLLGVSQPRVSHLRRGKIDRFSIDTLVTMLGQAGVKVTFTTKNHAEQSSRGAWFQSDGSARFERATSCSGGGRWRKPSLLPNLSC